MYKGLITWARLARLAGLLRFDEMIFSPVLHEVSQSGWWLMRWTAGDRNELDFGAKKARAARCIIVGSCSFQNLFPAVGCMYDLLHSRSYMDFYFCFFYIERGILISWWLTLRGREIYLLRSARNWNYQLYSRLPHGPGWPGKRKYMEKNISVRLAGVPAPRYRDRD